MKILFYQTENGFCPMKAFLCALNQKSKNEHAKVLMKKIAYTMELLKERNGYLPKELAKKVTDNIWELRPLDHRIFYFFWKNRQCVILHAFRKKSRKTPLREIRRAEAERKDWIKRYGE